MKKTFNELDNDLRDIITKMEKAVKTEWAEYQSYIVAKAWEAGEFSGDLETDQAVLETLNLQIRLHAAEQMVRNTSTWSGGAGNSNNVVEGIRHSAASEIFSGTTICSLLTPYRKIVGTK